MCTTLTGSRSISRCAPMKGIKSIGFAKYDGSNLIVNTTTGVVALPAYLKTPPSIARFEVKATGNKFDDTGTFDEATRTNEFVGVNTVFIPGNDIALRNAMMAFNGSLWLTFIEDYNGKVFVFGSGNGADITTVVNSSDTQGWTVTVQSKERNTAFEITGTGITDYLAAIMPIG